MVKYRLPAGSISALLMAGVFAVGASWLAWSSTDRARPLFLIPVVLTALPLLVYGRLRETAAQLAVWAMATFMIVMSTNFGPWYAPSVLALIWYSLPDDQ
jgi:hypothetical protein